MRWLRGGFAALAVACAWQAATTWADNCVRCGAPACSEWVCRPRPTTRLVEKSVWDTVCEPICVPACTTDWTIHHGANNSGCDNACDNGCDSAGDDAGCADAGGGHSLCDWLTGKHRVRPRHRLMRKTVVECVPYVDYVVEPRCRQCCHLDGCLPAGAVPAGATTCETPGGDLQANLAPVSRTADSADDDAVPNAPATVADARTPGAVTHWTNDQPGTYLTIDQGLLPPLPDDHLASTSNLAPVRLQLPEAKPTVWLGSIDPGQPSSPVEKPRRASTAKAEKQPAARAAATKNSDSKTNQRTQQPKAAIRTVSFDEEAGQTKPATSARR